MDTNTDPAKQRDHSSGGGSDHGTKGTQSYPVEGGPAVRQNDGSSGGGSDQGTKGTQSYPVEGGPMAKP